MQNTSLRRRVLGVDFSGARNAGRHIWIAEGKPGGSGLSLTSCIPASDLPEGGAARDVALVALVAHIGRAGAVAVGLDFPFGLPAQYVSEPDWESFVRGFRSRYPTAEVFRASLRAASAGGEIKRRTDIYARTPFCAWNLRLYRQTWHGIADVLAPLVCTGLACAAPMQRSDPARPLLLETCPASLLKAEDLYQPYKGRGAEALHGRKRILDAVVERSLLAPPPPPLQSVLLDDHGGDALDAVLAAICTAKAVADAGALLPADEIERLEARVYF